MFYPCSLSTVFSKIVRLSGASFNHKAGAYLFVWRGWDGVWHLPSQNISDFWSLSKLRLVICSPVTLSPLPVCLVLLLQGLNPAHEMECGFRRIVLQSAWGVRMLSMLQCLSSCLSTLSQKSTQVTNHYKKSQLFIVCSPTGPALLIFQGAVRRPAVLSELPSAQSFMTAPGWHFSKYQW